MEEYTEFMQHSVRYSGQILRTHNEVQSFIRVWQYLVRMRLPMSLKQLRSIDAMNFSKTFAVARDKVALWKNNLTLLYYKNSWQERYFTQYTNQQVHIHIIISMQCSQASNGVYSNNLHICVIAVISIVKLTRCTNVSNLFYFRMTLYSRVSF